MKNREKEPKRDELKEMGKRERQDVITKFLGFGALLGGNDLQFGYDNVKKEIMIVNKENGKIGLTELLDIVQINHKKLEDENINYEMVSQCIVKIVCNLVEEQGARIGIPIMRGIKDILEGEGNEQG